MSSLHDDFDNEISLHDDFDNEEDLNSQPPTDKPQLMNPPSYAAPDTSEADRKALTSDGLGTFGSRGFNAALGGLGDKALAAGSALWNSEGDKAPFGQRYSETLGREDANTAPSEDEHGNWSKAGKGVGMATNAIAGGMAGVGKLGAAGGGALYGALGSLGADRSRDWKDTASNTIVGAGEGAAIGSVLGFAGNKASEWASGSNSTVGKFIRSILQKKGAQLVENAGPAERSAAAEGVASDAGGNVSSGHMLGDIETTQARNSRLGGEVNAAANNAQNRMAVENQVAAAADPEAARFMANRMRSFNGSRRATPEYQNTGDLTKVESRDAIGGRMRGSSQPPATPAEEAIEELTPEPASEAFRQYDVLSPIPRVRTAAERASMPPSQPSAPTGGINRYSVTAPLPKAPAPPVEEATANIRQGAAKAAPSGPPPPPASEGPQGELLKVATPMQGDGSITPEQLAAARAHPNNNQNPAGAGQVALGGLKGAYQSSRHAFAPSMGVGFLNHHAGAAMESAATLGGAAKGAYGALNPAQQYGAMEGVQNAFNRATSFDGVPAWRANLYRAILQKAPTQSLEGAAGPATSNYTEDDKRRN